MFSVPVRNDQFTPVISTVSPSPAIFKEVISFITPRYGYDITFPPSNLINALIFDITDVINIGVSNSN